MHHSYAYDQAYRDWDFIGCSGARWLGSGVLELLLRPGNRAESDLVHKLEMHIAQYLIKKIWEDDPTSSVPQRAVRFWRMVEQSVSLEWLLANVQGVCTTAKSRARLRRMIRREQTRKKEGVAFVLRQAVDPILN